jgi:hypothetical protein
MSDGFAVSLLAGLSPSGIDVTNPSIAAGLVNVPAADLAADVCPASGVAI